MNIEKRKRDDANFLTVLEWIFKAYGDESEIKVYEDYNVEYPADATFITCGEFEICRNDRDTFDLFIGTYDYGDRETPPSTDVAEVATGLRDVYDVAKHILDAIHKDRLEGILCDISERVWEARFDHNTGQINETSLVG